MKAELVYVFIWTVLYIYGLRLKFLHILHILHIYEKYAVTDMQPVEGFIPVKWAVLHILHL